MPVYPVGHKLAGEPLDKRDILTAKKAGLEPDGTVRPGSHIARTKADLYPHSGINDETVHRHEAVGKYVFPPGPKIGRIWGHDHLDIPERGGYHGKPDRLQEHLASRASKHEGIDVLGYHEHVAQEKDPRHVLAKRLDMHPRARSKFKDANRVFFVIEGCVKADAVLSAGEAVSACPASASGMHRSSRHSRSDISKAKT